MKRLAIHIIALGSALFLSSMQTQAGETFLASHAMQIHNSTWSEEPLQIQAAKNEYESIILITKDLDCGMYELSVGKIIGLKDSVQAITNLEVDFFVVENVESRASHDPEATFSKRPLHDSAQLKISIPDKLIPVSMGRIALGKEQVIIWCRVYVPPDAVAGHYKLPLLLKLGEQLIARQDISLQVWNFLLPKMPSFPFMVGVPRGAEDAEVGTEPYRKLLRDIAQHRCSIRYIQPEPTINFDKRCNPVIDFTEYDEAARFAYEELGMAVTQFPLVYVWRAHGKGVVDSFGPSYRYLITKEFKNKFERSVQLLVNHLSEKGWLDRNIFLFFDEPTLSWYPMVKKISKMMQTLDPRIRCGVPDISDRLIVLPSMVVSRRPPCLSLYPPAIENLRADIRARADGRHLLTYLGTLDASRELEFMVDVVAHLANTGLPVFMFILGVVTDQEDKDKLEDHIKHRKLENAIQIYDPIPECHLPAVVPLADVGLSPLPVNPVLRTNSPIKTMDYLRFGVTVVGTLIPDNEYVLTNSHGGLTANQNVVDFAKKIQRLLNESRDIRKLRLANARAWLARERSLPIAAALLRDCFENTLQTDVKSYRPTAPGDSSTLRN